MIDIEARLKEFEDKYVAKIAELELKLEKERIARQIQNVMGRYAYMHTGGMHTECAKLFANGDPEMSIEIGPGGVFYGADAAYRAYTIGHNAGEGNRVGFMAEHTLTTPVIEVADDLQTAKALWISPGHETGFDPDKGGLGAQWMWGRYAVEFKCIDGEWKMWHFQMFPTFRCDYDTSWVDTEPADRIFARERIAKGLDPLDSVTGKGEYGPNFPTTFFEEYASDRVMKYWPQPPEPYATYAGSRSMVGAPPADVAVVNEFYEGE